jgi:hypothetical protein
MHAILLCGLLLASATAADEKLEKQLEGFQGSGFSNALKPRTASRTSSPTATKR